MADAPREIDPVSGTETTGHEWDGIKELNEPLPKWWLYVFYVCIAWSVVYWLLMPAWPLASSFTGGLLGYSQRAVVAADIEAAREAQAVWRERIEATELDAIAEDDELLRFALAGGAAAFGDNCAPCHGSGAQGFKGYPNLNDDDWLWGGTVDDIHTTLLYGIRGDHDDTRLSEMPAFGRDQLLSRGEIEDAASFVMSLSGEVENQDAADRGAEVYAENCASCHGDGGEGVAELGAPNLTDGIWLYGGDRADIVASIHASRAGVMPAWEGRLDPATIKQLAVYVHTLGGGQ